MKTINSSVQNLLLVFLMSLTIASCSEPETDPNKLSAHQQGTFIDTASQVNEKTLKKARRTISTETPKTKSPEDPKSSQKLKRFPTPEIVEDKVITADEENITESLGDGWTDVRVEEGPPFGANKQDPDEIHTFVDKAPEFPGGWQALNKYIAQNLKYPEEARDLGLMGRVYLRFVVHKDGSISDVKVMRGVHSSLDKEAIRVVQSMPNWKPGRLNGVPVNAYVNIPVKFELAK